MDKLRTPYEISLWQDVYEDGAIVEKKAIVIGTDQMNSLNRAIEPKLTSKTSGENTFSFSLYYRYIDNETGEEVFNPYCKLISNESKIKVKYDGKWYDFIVKAIKEDSSKYIFSYELTDQFINELGKTGYDIEFSDELENNLGTVLELTDIVLENTDWELDENSDCITREETETTFKVLISTGQTFTAYELIKSSNGAVSRSNTPTTIGGGSLDYIYPFYSCCTEKPKFFQFMYLGDNPPQVDSERILLNGTQYLVELSESDYKAAVEEHGLYLPNKCASADVNPLFRAKRYAYTQELKYDSLLERYVEKYSRANDETVYWHYTDTEYISPNIIDCLTSNHTDFKSYQGWVPGWYGSSSTAPSDANRADVRVDTAPSILERLEAGQAIGTGGYDPVLRFKFSQASSSSITHTIANYGLTYSKKKIKSLKKGDLFVCLMRLVNVDGSEIGTLKPTNCSITVANSSFNASNRKFDTITSSNTYITFNGAWSYINEIPDPTEADPTNTLSIKSIYTIGTVTQSVSEESLMASNFKLNTFITFYQSGRQYYYLVDFEIFRYYPGGVDSLGNNIPLLPMQNKLEVYTKSREVYFEDYSLSEITKPELIVELEDDGQFIPVYVDGVAKRKTINASKSNRFNIIQEICETFLCWASFDIAHDAEGNITSKKVAYHNYVGQDNPLDFVYGVNLSSIQRSIDSKQFTTKLIVLPGTNEYAKNGVSTISRAKANASGEDCIINFDYYINLNMLDAAEYQKDMYLKDDESEYLGYFTRLKEINNQLLVLQEKIANLTAPLSQAIADVNTFSAALDAANDSFEEDSISIFLNYNHTYTAYELAQPGSALYIELHNHYENGVNNDTLLKLIIRCKQYQSLSAEYTLKLAAAQSLKDDLLSSYDEINELIEELKADKDELHLDFYTKYSRFIQEGTWTSNEYIDDNLYFYDALSVSYESSMPKISYTINVIDVAPVEGYEAYKYKIGDKTYIQDTEFFGYVVENGLKTPAREAVVVSEVTWSLDEPSKNTIKVLTYKNQFADLFQRITATVQQAQYQEGSYLKAAALAEADTAYKISYLKDALQSAANVLTNAGDQSVVWDNTGITVKNNLDPSQVLKIVSGGILISDTGGQDWQLGVTTEGISANLITSGQVDTGLILIMNGSESYFRWDTYGLTAFDFSDNGTVYIGGPDYQKGIRFDRFGIYCFKGKDGTLWHPTNVVSWDSSTGEQAAVLGENIRAYSRFELTEEGLYLNLGDATYDYAKTQGGTVWAFGTPKVHSSISKLGKVNDLLHNTWDMTQTVPVPYYVNGSANEEFAEVLRISNGDASHYIKMFDDGTILANNVFLEGKITATGGKIGNWLINGNIRGQTFDGLVYDDPSATGYTAVGIIAGNWLVDDTWTASASGTHKVRFFAGSNSDPRNGSFIVTHDGWLKATHATIEGAITATSGTIGGFTIGTTGLYNGKTSFSDTTAGVYLGTDGIALGANNVFNVTSAGALTSKSGTIGGWTIGANSIYNAAGSNPLYLYSNGATTIDASSPAGTAAGSAKSNIVMRLGSSSNATFALGRDGNIYAANGYFSGTVRASAGSIGGFIVGNNLLLDINDTFFLYGNGDGIAYASSPIGKAASYGGTDINNLVLRALKPGAATFGVGKDGKVYVSDLYGKFGDVRLYTDDNGLFIATREGDSTSTYNFRTSFNVASNYVTMNAGPSLGTRAGVTVNYSATEPDLQLYGNIYAETILPRSPATSASSGFNLGSNAKKWASIYCYKLNEASSRLYKKNILLFDDSYDVFFDNLIPRTFEYNAQKEDTTNFGFIVDEVYSAILKAGLDPLALGLYDLEDSSNPYGPGGLAYSLFTALNTWQIQKLKSRVAELESRVAQLEANLTNS